MNKLINAGLTMLVLISLSQNAFSSVTVDYNEVSKTTKIVGEIVFSDSVLVELESSGRSKIHYAIPFENGLMNLQSFKSSVPNSK